MEELRKILDEITVAMKRKNIKNKEICEKLDLTYPRLNRILKDGGKSSDLFKILEFCRNYNEEN